MNHDWTDEIREKLAEYSEQPPCQDPKALRDSMAKAARAAHRQATVMAWGRRLAVAAAIIAIALPPATTLLHRETRVTHEAALQTAHHARQPLPAQDGQTATAEAHSTANAAPYKTAPAAPAAVSLAMATTTQRPEQDAPAQDARTDTPRATQQQMTSITQATAPQETARRTAGTTPSPDATGKTAHRLSAALAMGAAATATTATSASTAMLAKADPFGWHASQFDAENSRPTLAQAKPTATSVHHSQPITVALALSYRLDRRWSLSAGLSYSYHHSEFTAAGDNYSSLTTRRLHYIGVPVAASYTIWSNRCLSIYATAGGSIEKAIAGKADTRTIVNGKEQNSDSHNVSISALQLSANAGLGAELRIAPRLAAYAEPGVSYHFDNGSDTPTFYSDNPLAFSLNVGLRLDITR